MRDDFEALAKQIMEENAGLFEALAKHDVMQLTQRERDIVNYLVDNSVTIQADIQAGHNPHYKLLPGSLPDIYPDHYRDHATEVVRNHLVSFNLSPEESAGLKGFIKRTVGESWLTPR